MAVTRLTTNGLTGTKYDIASADNYYMEPIATTLLGSAAANVTFSNIPNTYKHLQIRVISKSTGVATQGDLTFNGDTGNNYAWHQLFGNGASVGADNSINRANVVGAASLVNSSITSVFSASIIDILDYASTNKYKTVRHLVGQDENGSGVISLNSGLWMNTASITSITITARSASIAQHSRFSLYGIKG